jgi:hypothetical protein
VVSRTSSAAQRGTAHLSQPIALFAPMEHTSMESSLQVILRRAARREQRAFAILGFLTGLALSAVIGGVLYVFLAFG